MVTHFQLRGGVVAVLLLPPRDKMLALVQKAFRSCRQHYAGNFCQWNSLREFLADEEVHCLLSELFQKFVERGKRNAQYFECVTLSSFVGWQQHVPLRNLTERQIAMCTTQQFGRSRALVLPKGEVLAPLTRKISFTFGFSLRDSVVRLYLGDMYPGQLRGRISVEHGPVILLPDNPGEELP